MGLCQKWRRLASYEDEDGQPELPAEEADRLISCADELAAALSGELTRPPEVVPLSEEEREALARADRFAARGDEILLEDYITLRALIARVTGDKA